MPEYGYGGEILKVDLSTHNAKTLETSEYAKRFLGGKGTAAKLYWDMVPPQTKAFDPENCLVFTNGPVAGFSRFASSRWMVCGKSATADPEAFSYCNLGGSWGNRLKNAGYDGLVVQGKAEKPVYLYVHNDSVEIRDASHLWGKSAFESFDVLKAELGKTTSVLTIGQAAENLVVFATLLADQGASGSAGMGSVMGSKNLKAIVVSGDKKPIAADPEELQKLADRVRELTQGPVPDRWWIIPGVTKPQVCHRCGIGCTRQTYRDAKGHRFKCFCQAIDTYRRPAEKYHNGWNEVILLAMRLCDKYGLDTSVMQAMIEWLIRCYKEGVLSEKDTGLPLSEIGGPKFIETLTSKIALREGFGDMLARGTLHAAENVGGRANELLSCSVMNRSNEVKDYDPRLILHNSLLIATEPRRPLQQVHEPSGLLMEWLDSVDGKDGADLTFETMCKIAEKFWGSAEAADYSSYEGKAQAVKMIQDRTYAHESLIFCNARWPMIYNRLTQDHVGDPTLATGIFSAVTGRKLGVDGLNRIGERVFNLQRAIMVRQGWGGRDGDRLLDYCHEEPIQYLRFNRECRVPGKNGKVTSRKGAVVDRTAFEMMKTEYYERRGWDVQSGFPGKAKLMELDLKDVAEDLEKSELST